MAEFKIEEPKFNPQQIEEISQRAQELIGNTVESPQKREVLKEVIREKIQTAYPSKVNPQQQEEEIPAKFSQIKNLPEEKKVDALVKIAIQDSIADAVKNAQKLGPYYIDALHDALVDEFLNILIQQKKI
ncbi:MAG TPA: hypothetical protein PK168_01895 [Candidatus Paceibacterota bacterium]|jgi:hypothetical protein|nr:hypothetical protein [Candidatus Paceibacterota bacterium]HPC37398.1 hypothetical protein [Candidatus Paceibacterota bacterium]HRU35859.1 hypothetical protein [Candidatus Paceibacterota bacterium]